MWLSWNPCGGITAFESTAAGHDVRTMKTTGHLRIDRQLAESMGHMDSAVKYPREGFFWRKAAFFALHLGLQMHRAVALAARSILFACICDSKTRSWHISPRLHVTLRARKATTPALGAVARRGRQTPAQWAGCPICPHIAQSPSSSLSPGIVTDAGCSGIWKDRQQAHAEQETGE